MGPSVKVALVRYYRRRGAVAQALALLCDWIKPPLGEPAVVLPQLSPGLELRGSTHSDTLSSVIDFLIAAGASPTVVCAFSQDFLRRTRALGYADELWGRKAILTEPHESPEAWETIRMRGPTEDACEPRIGRVLRNSRYRVVLSVMSSRAKAVGAPGLFALLQAMQPMDREHMCRNRNATWLARGRSVRTQANADRFAQWIVQVARYVWPSLSVLDGFHSRKWAFRSGTGNFIVAGTDAVAVDAVALHAVGRNPRQSRVLQMAERLGLGVANLDKIDIVGDQMNSARRALHVHGATLPWAGRGSDGRQGTPHTSSEINKSVK